MIVRNTPPPSKGGSSDDTSVGKDTGIRPEIVAENHEAYRKLLEDKIGLLKSELADKRSWTTLIMGILLLVLGLLFGSLPLLFSDAFSRLIESSNEAGVLQWWPYTFTVLAVTTIVAAFRFLKIYANQVETRLNKATDLQRLKSIQIAWELSKGLPITLGEPVQKIYPMQRAQSQIIETLLSN